MHVEVNGTRLWFDIDGRALVPDGPQMRERPTIVLLHGGPGSYDHSYFKPPSHGCRGKRRSSIRTCEDMAALKRGNPADSKFEVCADDIGAFSDTLGIAKPVVYGHSLGGYVAMVYAARHPVRRGRWC